MKVTEVHFDMPGYLAARFGHVARTPGLHVSQVYGDLDRALNIKRYKNAITPEQLDAFASIGFLWERILEDTLGSITISGDPSRYFRPGEVEMDGLLATPDYADLDFRGDGTNQLGLEEWKVSWSSVRKLADYEGNFWRWLVQMKWYCRALGTVHARQRILFIVGDWRESIAPVCKVLEFEFSEQELEENWAMITGHAKRKGWM